MSKADELRSRLPGLTSELSDRFAALISCVEAMRDEAAIRRDPDSRGYCRALEHVLKAARPTIDTNESFLALAKAAAADVGVTQIERQILEVG